jgi:hypothetical protein
MYRCLSLMALLAKHIKQDVIYRLFSTTVGSLTQLTLILQAMMRKEFVNHESWAGGDSGRESRLFGKRMRQRWLVPAT